MYCNICDQKAINLKNENEVWTRVPLFRIQQILHDNHWCEHEISRHIQNSIETIAKEFDKQGCRIFTFEKDFRRHENYGKLDYYSFYDDMIDACPDIFPDCQSNHEVGDKLRIAGVITGNEQEDSESDGFCVHIYPDNHKEGFRFNTAKQPTRAAKAFIKRLNKYVEDKHAAIDRAHAM